MFLIRRLRNIGVVIVLRNYFIEIYQLGVVIRMHPRFLISDRVNLEIETLTDRSVGPEHATRTLEIHN